MFVFLFLQYCRILHNLSLFFGEAFMEHSCPSKIAWIPLKRRVKAPSTKLSNRVISWLLPTQDFCPANLPQMRIVKRGYFWDTLLYCARPGRSLGNFHHLLYPYVLRRCGSLLVWETEPECRWKKKTNGPLSITEHFACGPCIVLYCILRNPLCEVSSA